MHRLRPLFGLVGALFVAALVPLLVAPAVIRFRVDWTTLATGMLLQLLVLIGLGWLLNRRWIAAVLSAFQLCAAGLFASFLITAGVADPFSDAHVIVAILLAVPASLGALLFETVAVRASSPPAATPPARSKRAASRKVRKRRAAALPGRHRHG